MKIYQDKVLEYIDWFIENEIIKYGGSQQWRERKECRCGPATYATILQARIPQERYEPNLAVFLDCTMFLDPWYPEGILVFWPSAIEIPNIPYAAL